jgi:hypothetical protein
MRGSVSKGPVLNIPLKDLQEYQESAAPALQGSEKVSLKEASDAISADLIIRTLRETNGIVGGGPGRRHATGNGANNIAVEDEELGN